MSSSVESVVDIAVSERPQVKRARKTTSIQFEKMNNFMQLIDRKTVGQIQFDGLWETFVEELNELGPPSHTSGEWKKVWYDYKLKNMRRTKQSTVHKLKTLTSVQANLEETDNQIGQQASSSSTPAVQKDKLIELGRSHLETAKEHHSPLIMSDMMEKLNVIIEETKKIKEIMEVMVAILKK